MDMNMDETLSTLEKRLNAVKQDQMRLHEKHASILQEIEVIRAKQVAEKYGLTRKEIVRLRRALTILGEMLSADTVIFANVHLRDEEPGTIDKGNIGSYLPDEDEPIQKYSFTINCSYVEDCAVGLCYNVDIKTKNDGVRAIVRSMIDTNMYINDDENEDSSVRNSWHADWDYHTKILLKNPMSSEEYYATK